MDSPEADTNLTPIFLQIANGFSPTGATIIIIAILLLLTISALIAGTETAFFSLSPKDIVFLKNKDAVNTKLAAQLLEQPKILLATLLVANNFINIAIVVSTNFLVNMLLPHNLPAYIAFTINVVGVTFLLVLFGEVLPKVYATQNNLRLTLFVAPYIRVLVIIFMPVSKLLVSSTKFIESKLSSKQMKNMSSADFEHAIELTVGHTASRQELNIFKGIIKFGNIAAKQIMRTRMDVSAIDYEMTFKGVKKYCIEAGYSRLPVYNETLDNIAGIIHTKDFLPYYNDDNFDWHQLLRAAFFVHESKPIEDLLHEFQQKRIHFAIVVDEFGGTSGIITLEDIMEEIIGDIKDEFDEEDLNYKKIDDYTYIFEGKTLINDVCRIIGEEPNKFEAARGQSDSLAGLILEISGKFPAINEIIRFDKYSFMVIALEKMRIQRVKLTISKPNLSSV